MKKALVVIIPLALIVLSFALSGKHTNPPVENQVAWDSPQTKEVFYRSCADCHSHETVWPWYSRFAPISWRVIDHVDEGREEFNISVRDMGDADEAAETVQEGEMPLRDYLLLHSNAKLSGAAKDEFIAGLLATFGGESRNGDHESREYEDDDSDDD